MLTLSPLRRHLFKQRRFRRMIWIAVTTAVVFGILIVPLEAGAPGGSIGSLSDGLWWAVQTLTTVGYGDVVPVTVIGRILGVILIVVGTALFGVVVAMISSTMSRSQEEFYWNRLFERLDRLEADITDLKRHNNFLVKDKEKDEES